MLITACLVDRQKQTLLKNVNPLFIQRTKLHNTEKGRYAKVARRLRQCNREHNSNDNMNDDSEASTHEAAASTKLDDCSTGGTNFYQYVILQKNSFGLFWKKIQL
jgi:hypothetical protein